MKITNTEYKILKDIKQEHKYKWIVRDYDNTLQIFQHKPFKDEDLLFWDSLVETYDEYKELSYCDHLFLDIKWEDDKPYKIEQLLKESKTEKGESSI